MKDTYYKVPVYMGTYHFVGHCWEIEQLIRELKPHGGRYEIHTHVTDEHRRLAAETQRLYGERIASDTKHGRYLNDLWAFRAVHGFNGDYQEGWREKGPAKPREPNETDREIAAYYDRCRELGIDSGD